VCMLTHMLTDGIVGLKTSFEGNIVEDITPYQVGQVKPGKASRSKKQAEPDVEKMKANAYTAKLGIPGKCIPCWYSVAQRKEDVPSRRVYHNPACTTNLGEKTRIIWVNAHRFPAKELFKNGCKNCLHLWLAQLMMDGSPRGPTTTSIISMDRVATWHHYFDVYELWASEPKGYREWYTCHDTRNSHSSKDALYPFDPLETDRDGMCKSLSMEGAMDQLLATQASQEQRAKAVGKGEPAPVSGSSTDSCGDQPPPDRCLGYSWVMLLGVISTELVPIPKLKKRPDHAPLAPAHSLRYVVPDGKLTTYAKEFVRSEFTPNNDRFYDFGIPVDVPHWIVKTDTETASNFPPHKFLRRERWGPAQWNISVTVPHPGTAGITAFLEPTEWSWYKKETKSLIFFPFDAFPFEYDIDEPNGPKVPILHFTRYLTPKVMEGFKRFPLGILWQLYDWGDALPPMPGPLNVQKSFMGPAMVGIRAEAADNEDPHTVRGYEQVPGWGNDVQRCILKGEVNTHWILLDRPTGVWYTRPWSTFPFAFPYQWAAGFPTDVATGVAAVSQHPTVTATGFPDAVMTNPMTCEVYEVCRRQTPVYEVGRRQTALRDVSKDSAIAKLPAGEPGSSFNPSKVADLPPPPDLPSNSPAVSPTRGA